MDQIGRITQLTNSELVIPLSRLSKLPISFMLDNKLRQRIIALLEKIEFSSEWCGNYHCSSCEENTPNHKQDCELKTVLDELKNK